MNTEQQKYVDMLHDTIKDYTVPMAVVDYLGRQYQVFGSHDLKFATVTEDTELGERFGVRDMRHVVLYDLKVVRKNRAAAS